MIQIHEETFVEHKFQSLLYKLRWDSFTVGDVTMLVDYDRYQTWMVDEFGNKRNLISESRVITNADYTDFKVTVLFNGQVLQSTFTPNRYTFKYQIENVLKGGTTIQNLYVEATPLYLP